MDRSGSTQISTRDDAEDDPIRVHPRSYPRQSASTGSRRHSSASTAGFTLIELLVVIAIVAILSVVVILVLNPAELLKQARDSNRLQDLGNINTALNLFQTDTGGAISMGSASTTYVSIPDPVATSTLGDQCQGLGLPSLPTGWSYHCAASSTYRLVNGTGWIPVDLTAISFKSPLALLPVDPVNQTSSRNYYTYTPGGSWELATAFEAARNKLGGAADKASQDGGQYPDLYELGTNLTLMPIDYGDSSLVGYWKFDEGSGTNVSDSSGNGNTGTWQGTLGSQWTTGKVGSGAGNFNGTSNYISISNQNGFASGDNHSSAFAWIKTSLTSSEVVHWYGVYANTEVRSLIINYPSAGQVSFVTIQNDVSITPAVNVDDNTWHYIGYVYNGNKSVTFYVDGVSYSASTAGALNTTIGGSHIIGRDGNSNVAYFNGLIDDVRIYNRALSAAEISAMYNATK